MDSFKKYRDNSDCTGSSDSLDIIDATVCSPVVVSGSSSETDDSIITTNRKKINKVHKIVSDDENNSDDETQHENHPILVRDDKDRNEITFENDNVKDSADINNSYKYTDETVESKEDIEESKFMNDINDKFSSTRYSFQKQETLDGRFSSLTVCANKMKTPTTINLEEHENENLSDNMNAQKVDEAFEENYEDLQKAIINSLNENVEVIDLSDSVDDAKEVSNLINNVHIDQLRNNADDEQKNAMLAEKQRLHIEIENVEKSIREKKRIMSSVNVNTLPDKGMKLKVSLLREEDALFKLNDQMKRVIEKLKLLGVAEEQLCHARPVDVCAGQRVREIKEKLENETAKMPKFGYLPSANIQDMGKRALETHRVQQSLTVDALRRLHNSLKNCPSERSTTSDPDGLKIPLLQHQKEALSWLMWRETEKPLGGILADDMGLGKTLTMIALILKSRETKKNYDNNESTDEDSESEENTSANSKRYKGGTLVVCPASIVGQWESEFKNRTKRGLVNIEIYHGPNREKKGRRLARLDVVITSYKIVQVEGGKKRDDQTKGTLFSVQWERVILDEAHVIRNYKSQTATAVYQLRAKRRWALTGTPVHNKEQDFFSLLKFIRCAPFDDIDVWKKWVESKDSTGTQRLNTLTRSLMLRRTKEILIREGKLESLPQKTAKYVKITLNENEQKLYEEILNFSKTLLAQFLHQKAEKENLLTCGLNVNMIKNKHSEEENPFSNHPVLERLWYKVHSMENVKSHEILVLLLRLRQICCHPALMKGMLEGELLENDGIEDNDGVDMELLERMSAMNVNDSSQVQRQVNNPCKPTSILSLDNPIFNPEQDSSKIKAALKLLEEDILTTDDDKVVVVSQWSSMLDLLRDALLKRGWKCSLLSGKVPVEDRTEIVNQFNNKSKPRILLLSLTAGGTGLNLVGGNHLIMIDPHWNPQLESQACDRVYRFGQKKPVKVYRLICSETIEENIQLLQQKKLEMANSVLTGARNVQATKLTLDDLKMLFNIS